MTNLISGIAMESWAILAEMAPYLLFGFIAAGVLSVCISPEKVERHLGGTALGSIIKASVFGVPLPLCSCSVIPVAASLRRHGASKGATTAFLLSTPQTGVDSIFVTFALLGPVFAIFRPLVALVTGIVGGAAVMAFGDSDTKPETPPSCSDPCCSGERNEHGIIWRILHHAFVTLPNDIGKELLIGLLIVGVISAAIPEDFFASVIGTGMLAILVMMLLGLPMYVCATASVPIAAALIAKGISPGAAFAFLMTGPATNAAMITTLHKILGRRSTVIYLLTVVVGAFGFGVALDAFFAASSISPGEASMQMSSPWFNNLCAIALLLILLKSVLRSAKADDAHDEAEHESDSVLVLNVKGMTCAHCTQSVTSALRDLEGVHAVNVALKEGTVRISGHFSDPEILIKAIEDLGFSAEIKS